MRWKGWDKRKARWAERAEFVYDSEPLDASLRRAQALADGADRPVLLLDHSDNCMSGGTCDSMNELMAAGMGAHTTVRLGNKVPLTQLGVAKEPVASCCSSRACTAGRCSCRSRMRWWNATAPPG